MPLIRRQQGGAAPFRAKLHEEQQLLLSSQAATPDNRDKVTASVSVNLLESISTTALTWNRPTAASICQSHQMTPMTGRSGIRMQGKNVAMSQLQRNNKPQWNHGARRRQRTRQGHKLTSVWVLGCLNVLRKKVTSRNFANAWTNYKWMICTRERKRDLGRLDLDLESHMLPMSISGLFNYCNAVASPPPGRRDQWAALIHLLVRRLMTSSGQWWERWLKETMSSGLSLKKSKESRKKLKNWERNADKRWFTF